MILLSQPGSTDHLALTADSMAGLAITPGSTDDQIALTADSMDGLGIMTVSIDDLVVTTGHNWLVLLLCYLFPR
jgi:hypothetical protein